MDLQHPLTNLLSESISRLSRNAVDFAMSNGIVMEVENQSSCTRNFIHAPFTLFPSSFPKSDFDFVSKLQPHINVLMLRVSQDYDFLCESLQSVADVDDFMKKQLDIFKQSFSVSGMETTLGLLRSDYMINVLNDSPDSYQAKQIEVNSMAASFMGIGTNKMKDLYSNVLSNHSANFNDIVKRVPINETLSNVAKGLVLAWKHYGANPDAAMVFFVSNFDNNIVDQRQLEYYVYAMNPLIKIKRQSFTDIDKCKLSVNADRTLFIDDDEIAVVYYRIGYMPNHYPTEKHWERRLQIEKSKAVKSPNMGHQLAGSKKIQEILARPGTVEKFIKDPIVCDNIRKTFAGLYSLEMNSEGDENVKMALENPSMFVLKPQREGGGNNLYDEDLVTCLKDVGNDNRRCSYSYGKNSPQNLS